MTLTIRDRLGRIVSGYGPNWGREVIIEPCRQCAFLIDRRLQGKHVCR